MNKDFNFDDIGKKMPYNSPDNSFFENTFKNVSKKANRSIFFSRVKKISWSAAAVVVLLATTLFILNINTNQDAYLSSIETNVDSINSNFYIVNDVENSINIIIQELSDQALEAFIDESQVNILLGDIF